MTGIQKLCTLAMLVQSVKGEEGAKVEEEAGSAPTGTKKNSTGQ